MRSDFAPPLPRTFDEILAAIGETGRRLSEIGASEGAAGNMSVLLWDHERPASFTESAPFELPVASPSLVGAMVLVTGSGRRLREVHLDPLANLALVEIGEEGRATVWTSPRRLFQRPTSEFNTHLAIHARFAPSSRPSLHAVVHAQPLHLTYLSHVPRYGDVTYLNRHILRWQPELIVQVPEGVGVVPFLMPGSETLMAATLEAMAVHQIVIWSKHGVIARSVDSIKKAGDLIEYCETGAHYETMNLTNHGLADGLTPGEVRSIAETFGREQRFF
jgi:rhamnulose-1-phosphate aldolase